MGEPDAAPELVWLGQLRLTLAPPISLRGVPTGTRIVGEASGVTFEGPRIRARQKGGASDWVTLAADGTASSSTARSSCMRCTRSADPPA